MIRLLTLILLATLTGFLSTGCSSVAPNAGEEAVLVRKPILFGHGGVDPTPVATGRKWVIFTTDAIIVSKQPSQYTIHFDDLMSLDGVPLDFDGTIRLQVTDSVTLVSKFGPNWYENNVAVEFSNRVRQAVRKHGLNETAINTKAIDAIDAEVSLAMEEYLKEAGLPLRLIQVTVGKANPPDAIKTQRIETAEQQQRVLTEAQRRLAEDSRQAAERARAQADNAYREAMDLSPNQFLQLEAIKAQRDICAKGGCTYIIGSAGVTPTLAVGAGK